MATIINPETQSIVVGTGNDRVAISLKQAPGDSPQSLLLTSIIIEMGDLEIQIRRSTKSKDGLKLKESDFSNGEQPQRIMLTNGNTNKKSIKEEKSHSQWDYSTLHGPHMWGRIFPAIQNKKFQSPIRIYTDQCKYDPELVQSPFIFEADDECCQILENTGHSFQVTGKGYSRIFGGPMLDEYRFLQFHMHWGCNELEGSEHVIDGVRSPGELHIVTWNTSRYQSPQAAAASESFDGLMVFGVLFKISPTDNAEIGPLLDLLNRVTYRGDKINLDSQVVSLKSLLPKNIDSYYTYEGSLTTPMCHESVRWIVFREKMLISRNQLEQLRELKHVCKGESNIDSTIQQNFRPVMPLHGRTVYRSFN